MSERGRLQLFIFDYLEREASNDRLRGVDWRDVCEGFAKQPHFRNLAHYCRVIRRAAKRYFEEETLF